MTPTRSDLIGLYETMFRIRTIELAQNELWERGLVSGEMHSGVGEEGIVAGVTAHLRSGDAVACDHRPTGVFVARGVDTVAILLELLGHEGGLNGGHGGHMHLMDRERLLLADGIVGSAGPAACGFALSAQRLRPGSVAVAFFGEGALNQGMLLESFNLASVWRLPVLFVCKDNGWSITTRTSAVSSTPPARRAEGFALRCEQVSGADVGAVHRAAGRLIDGLRDRPRPAFLHARCHRPDGHFLGDPLLRTLHDPVGQTHEVTVPLLGAARRPGGAKPATRMRATTEVVSRVSRVVAAQSKNRRWDPVWRARRRLDGDVADEVDERTTAAVDRAVERALAELGEP